MKIVVNKQEYLLTQRMAEDVLALSRTTLEETSAIDNIFIMALSLSQSLKATYKEISWLNIREKIKYFKFRDDNAKYLIKHLSLFKLSEYLNRLLEVEGSAVKKNLKQQAKS